MKPISVLVLTKNEESDIEECIASVDGCDDVWILDSNSTDRTVDIAITRGARVVKRHFDGFASQRNFALREIAFKYPWVLILDADERVSNELMSEMIGFVRNAPITVVAARMSRRDYFMGQWLKHAQISPFFIRLIRPGQVTYEREVNEVLVANGDVVSLTGHLNHFPFSKGISHWISKHNTYSSMEALELLGRDAFKPTLGVALFDKDFNIRRFHQKAFFYRLPARPLVKFLYMFIVRRAFLDGPAGINYTLLQCIYEYLISLKARERLLAESRDIRNRAQL
jgi:glycosyltransferase involved in cell wall biosynthesis